MEKQYLDLLACPRCHGPFTLATASLAMAAQCTGEGLLCVACSLFFPVREGIPVLLLDEAIVWNEGSDGFPADSPEDGQ